VVVRVSRHIKIPGFVEWVKPDGRWGARLFPTVDGEQDECYAEMNAERFPLPDDRRGYGYSFTIHTTKRGHTYIYWPPVKRITKRQIKKGRIWARRIRTAFEWD
jgi:hypothetical protein